MQLQSLSTTSVAVVLAVIFGSVASQGGFDFDDNKFCPPYRCPKNQIAVPKWPLGLESMGCSAMGGGMQLMSPGSNSNDLHETCCDLRQACLQLCGAIKTYCDEEFTKCTTATCEGIADSEEKKNCDQSSNLYGVMLKLDQCQKYDQAQRSHCDCVPKDNVGKSRERVVRAFYKKYNPENIEKAASLAAKADTPTKFVGLLLKLVKKYPQSIKRVKDPQQEYMERIMREAKKKEEEGETGSSADSEEGDEGIVEDLGVDEL